MTFETLALIWPILSISAVVGATFLVVWLQDRAHDRKARKPSA
jgi:nitrate reductase NapE component